MQVVGKRRRKRAHFTRKGPVCLHGGLAFDAKGRVLSFLLHGCVELKKCWMGRGCPYSGLAQNARVGWMGGSEMRPLWALIPSDA